MTYDYHGSWESSTGINAPLYGTLTWDIYTVDKTTQFWISQISSRNKLILGIPLYGPSWTLSGSDTSVGASGTSGSPMQYREICLKIQNEGWTRVFDDVRRVPYAFGGGRWVGYDDAQSIQEKMNYVNVNGLGGAFIWEMTGDDSTGACGAGTFPLTNIIKSSLTNTVTEAPQTNPETEAPQTNPETEAPQTNPETEAPQTSPEIEPPPTDLETDDPLPQGEDFVCPSAGYFKNPSDCSSFYNCAFAGPILPSSCTPGLLWNDAIKACDWASNVIC